jgi:hypothetical protein
MMSTRVHRSQPQLTDAEFADAIRLLTDVGESTIGDAADALSMSRDRMRILISVVGMPARTIRVRGRNISLFTLSPDAEMRIVARHALQAARLEKRNVAHSVAVRAGRLAPSVPVWEGRSGQPHHFTTDGMGRVIAYEGPGLADLDLDEE